MRQSYSTRGAWAGCDVYDCYPKPQGMVEKAVERKWLSFVPPTSGMFIWLAMDFEAHPSFKEGEEESLEVQLWENLAENYWVQSILPILAKVLDGGGPAATEIEDVARCGLGIHA